MVVVKSYQSKIITINVSIEPDSAVFVSRFIDVDIYVTSATTPHVLAYL